METVVCSIDKRKEEVIDLLKELNLPYTFIAENEVKIFGQNDVYGVFLQSGHVHLEKHSRKSNRRVHKWTCAGLQAIESYLRQHAI